MTKRGIEILRQEERLMTEDEVKNVYPHLQDEVFFSYLITLLIMTQKQVLKTYTCIPTMRLRSGSTSSTLTLSQPLISFT